MSITRRSMLAAVPALGMAPSVPTMASATDCAEAPENPTLLAAYDGWLAAMEELADAKDDLAWLVDEWRHLWPLAPDEILRYANAGEGDDNAERDIVGRRLIRETASIGKPYSKEFRERWPKTCFAIFRAEEIAEDIASAKDRAVTGRTEKSREKNRKWRARYIAELETRLPLAEKYEAETARIREQSGVEGAKLRVKSAEQAAERAADAVSAASATTMLGVRLKAEVVVGETERVFKRVPFGVLGDGYRLARALLDITGDAS